MRHIITDVVEDFDKHRDQLDGIAEPFAKSVTDIANLHHEVAEALRRVAGNAQSADENGLEIQQVTGQDLDALVRHTA